ncbi:metalloregulator ArsR/SmtB family transcription factor [Mucilaginibacter sp. HMF5004]|uniref:ArsR/SmtB family transcription factor n=1 Tax=Mucilaginibacter rivuli TaxID=2857527 RepID=UPI001C5FAE4A|nr:metalloregulator ArsR/SmtB family transcription factor [Mucilaginibacter rivuli]MBW4891927.1 metalloregulator ArsR/SmtB family transcription factor [Mucilaginibacter rivuli]
MRRDVFQAIADPNRRAIINLLAGQKMNLNSVADQFEISRPAVSKHMKILTECGLVTITLQGRDHYCETNLKKLTEVTDWIDTFKVFWTKKLDALGDFLEKPEPEEPQYTGGVMKFKIKKK